MTKEEILEGHIKAIEMNYPPEKYSSLREALDYSVGLMEKELAENGLSKLENKLTEETK